VCMLTSLPLTFLSDLGQLLDLGDFLLAFLGEEMLRPHAPIVLVYREPRVFRDTVIILHTIGDRRKIIAISTLQPNLGRIPPTHLAGKEPASQNRPRGGTIRVVFVKGAVRSPNMRMRPGAIPDG